MRYTVTVTGIVDTLLGSGAIRSDAPALLESAHPAIERGSVQVVSVEPAPDAPTTVELRLSDAELRLVEETLARFRGQAPVPTGDVHSAE